MRLSAPFFPLLAFLVTALVPLRAQAADEIRCEFRDQFALEFRNDSANHLCASVPRSQCNEVIERIRRASQELRAKLQETCGSVTNLKSELSDVAGQRDSPALTARILERTVGMYGDYISLLSTNYVRIGEVLSAADGPLGPRPAAVNFATLTNPLDREREGIRAALGNQQLWERVNIGHAESESQVTGTDGRADPKLFAFRNGGSFMKKILKEKADAEKLRAELNTKRDRAAQNAQGLQQPPGSSDTRRPGNPGSNVSGGVSGLDMKSLASLATAGMGLAQAMKKNGAASATPDPTPPQNSTAAASKPAEIPISKLGDEGKGKTPSPVVGVDSNKKESNPSPASVPSASPYRELSDISKSNSAPLNPSATPATAKAGGGSNGGGGHGGGESDSVGAPKAQAGNEHKEEESQAPGFGGPMGGGGAPSLGGSPAMPAMPGADAGAPQSPEDSMKDLLHEMKETAEGALPSGDTQAAADIPMSDEDLFPRVRACYVRNLKRGMVLNGLGEKISEDIQ